MSEEGTAPDDLQDETLQFAQRAWDDAEREHHDQQSRRDRALNQLSTTRTVSWAMATVIGGAVIIGGDPVEGALANLGVQISMAATVACLSAVIVLSVLPNYWPHWQRLPGFERWSQLEAALGYAPALWSMAETANTVNRGNLAALWRLENVVKIASVLSALSALGLLTGAVLATRSVL